MLNFYRGLLAFSGLMLCTASAAEAQVAGSVFEVIVITAAGSTAQASMEFDDPGAFILISPSGQEQLGAYTEVINSTSGNSTLTIVATDGTSVSGLAVAQTLQLPITQTLPLTILYGISYGSKRLYFFVGYSLII